MTRLGLITTAWWSVLVGNLQSGRFSWGICKVVGSRCVGPAKSLPEQPYKPPRASLGAGRAQRPGARCESAKWSVRDVSVQQNHCQSNHISPQAQAWGLAAFSGRGPVANLQNLFSRRGALAPRKFCPPATIYVRKSLLAVY